MHEYRITKYNPAFRDSTGAYSKDEWTSFADIGRPFASGIFTREEYEFVEDAYVHVALAFLREAGLRSLRVEGLENHKGTQLSFSEGSLLTLGEVGNVIRRVLREECWCRLQSASGFVHVGWDYYMYVGVLNPCPAARRQAAETGLFVEEFVSPCHPDDS